MSINSSGSRGFRAMIPWFEDNLALGGRQRFVCGSKMLANDQQPLGPIQIRSPTERELTSDCPVPSISLICPQRPRLLMFYWC
jgi:hypothetical protein